jgi:hypothetical protein
VLVDVGIVFIGMKILGLVILGMVFPGLIQVTQYMYILSHVLESTMREQKVEPSLLARFTPILFM